MRRVVVVGCGRLGRQVAAAAMAKGFAVQAIVRTPGSKRSLEARRIPARVLDLDQDLDPDTGQNTGRQVGQYGNRACTAKRPDFHGAHVFYFVPPAGTGSEDRRIHRFLDLFSDGNLPASVVLLSVTGVYGDCGGAWVTEDTPVEPMTDRARRRLYVEQVFRRWVESQRVGYCILRAAGIYGPGRLPVARLRARKPVLDPSEPVFSNRIHEQDLVRVCIALLEKTHLNTLLNVADDAPSTMSDYFFQVADSLGLPRPPVISRRRAGVLLSDGMLSYLSESRRISNRRMKTLLGLELQYPTLADGLSAMKHKPSEPFA